MWSTADWWISHLACVSVGPSVDALVKDEFDAQPSHSAADGGHSIQTIQHTASSSAPHDAFNSPALLPPADSTSSASSSAFTSMAAGPASKSVFLPFVEPAGQNASPVYMHHFMHLLAIAHLSNEHCPGTWWSDIDDIALWVYDIRMFSSFRCPQLMAQRKQFSSQHP